MTCIRTSVRSTVIHHGSAAQTNLFTMVSERHRGQKYTGYGMVYRSSPMMFPMYECGRSGKRSKPATYVEHPNMYQRAIMIWIECYGMSVFDHIQSTMMAE
ncbi:hypothetical protein TNCV_1740861 [Trichonephila clavipes]|uniref:Uncharacterized protein n=1 Tax=Trichonephila clavipes TaxID=2585209 RepID=A0A8X6RID5_TRICX|nr:hypothetical protein TNCV_1740861 [Trichonephila clavipes]